MDVGCRVSAANSWTSASACSICCWRSNGGRVQAVVKSRHCGEVPGRLAQAIDRAVLAAEGAYAAARGARLRGGSASCSCSHRSNASSNSRADAGSVRTSNNGSTLASTGRSRSRSAQKPWIVLTCASSSPLSASSSRVRRVGVGAGIRAGPIEPLAQPQLELAGGLFGERHRDDLADVRAPLGQNRDDPADELRRLARSRPPLRR